MQEAVTSAVGRIYQEVLASPHLLRSTTEATRSLDNEDEQLARTSTQHRSAILRTITGHKQQTENNEILSQLIARASAARL
jgi:hypothetical protein